MGSSLRCIDIIYKAVRALRIRIVMLHCHFHINVILTAFEVHNIFIERRFALIQVCDKLLDSALIVKLSYDWLPVFLHPHILQNDVKSLGEERHLSEPLL